MKYVNRGSMHTSMCLNEIQQGVSIRLASLTSRTPENEMKSLSKIYPDVDKALQVAELIREGKELPILVQLLDNREREMIVTAAKKAERRKDSRNVYITECYSGNWRQPTHKIANPLAKKHGLG